MSIRLFDPNAPSDCIFAGKSKLVPLRDGHLVSRESDYIIYSVEAAYLDKVVAQYGPCQLQFSFAAKRSLAEFIWLARPAETDGARFVLVQLPRLALSSPGRRPSRHQSGPRSSNIFRQMSTSSRSILSTDRPSLQTDKLW